MSTSPNIQQKSPPSSVYSDQPQKVVVPMPIIQHHDEIYYYIFIKGSLYSCDSAVFGLEAQEIQALAKKFSSPCKEVENGVLIKKPVHQVVNSLAQLGYKIISTCGETDTIFTMQREI